MPPDFDDDVRITNTGQRIRAILVVVFAIAVVIGAILWYGSKQDEVKRHEDARTEFQKVHAQGYGNFWLKTQIDIKSMKNNQQLEMKLRTMVAGDPLAYAKYIKGKCLPILNESLSKYRMIAVPPQYTDKMGAVADAADKLYKVWNEFATELLGLEAYNDANAKLDESADAWLGAQQSRDKKYTTKAVRYLNTMKCVLAGEILFSVEPTDLKELILGSCTTNKAVWFKRVSTECMPFLLVKEAEPDEVYSQTLDKYRKAERIDHASVFGIKDC
jgi:hypothetical protein